MPPLRPKHTRRLHFVTFAATLLLAARVVWAAGTELYHLPGFYEPFAAISHLVGLVVFTFLSAILLWRGYRYVHDGGYHKKGRMFALGLYAFACVFQMTMSMLFHMLERGGIANRVLERLDHSAIFIFIAGTVTPIQSILFRGPMRWGPLTLLWITTITAVTLKAIFFDAMPPWLGQMLYLAIGWFAALSTIALYRRHDFNYIKPLVVGGIFYSLGAIMDLLGQLELVPGVIHAHEVFHLTVLAGAIAHWSFIYAIANQHGESADDTFTISDTDDLSTE